MKIIIGFFLSFVLVITSLFAWSYYPSYYGSYPYTSGYTGSYGGYEIPSTGFQYTTTDTQYQPAQYPPADNQTPPAQYPSPRQEGCPPQGPTTGNFPMQAPQQNQPTATMPTENQPQNMGGNIENQHRNLVVMFTKDVCPYCQYMKPIMQRAAMKYGKDITFEFVDILKQPNTPAQYGFSTVPHVVYFKDGKKLEAHGSGERTMTFEQVEAKIRTHFGDVASEN